MRKEDLIHSFSCSLIHYLADESLFGAWFVPGTMLGTGDSRGSKPDGTNLRLGKGRCERSMH